MISESVCSSLHFSYMLLQILGTLMFASLIQLCVIVKLNVEYCFIEYIHLNDRTITTISDLKGYAGKTTFEYNVYRVSEIRYSHTF